MHPIHLADGLQLPSLLNLDELFLAAMAFFYIVLPIFAARQGIIHAIWNGTIGILIFAVARLILVQRGFENPQSAVIAGFVGWFGIAIFGAKRSRRIPSSVRRFVIARDLKGKKFDGRKHHLDHRMPFARGGSHTADNLRVVDRRRNLKKGKKWPGLRDWF